MPGRGDGIEVVDSISLGVADNRKVGRLDPAGLPGHIERLDLHRADALVLSACVQMPSLPAIPAAEARTGLPVLTAATATARQLLDTLELRPMIEHAGSLLAPSHRLAPPGVLANRIDHLVEP